MYYGVSQRTIMKLVDRINLEDKLFRNKLGGKQQSPRFLVIKELSVQMEVIYSSDYLST